MNNFGRKLAGVGLGALFVVGLGAGLAYAQTTDNSSPSTTGPSATTPAPAQDPAHCHHGGRGPGGGGGGGGGGSAPSAPSQAPSAANPGSV